MALHGKHAGSGTITSQTAGDEVMCNGNTLLHCLVGGTATTSFQVLGLDGTWYDLEDGAVTTDNSGMWLFDFPASVKVRLNVSAYTSGDVDWQIVSNPFGS